MPKVTYSPGDVLAAADVNDFCQEGFVANSSLDTTAGDIGGAWTSYTATWTNISNGTKTGAYSRHGKTVFFRAKFVVTTSPGVAGNFTVTLPVTATSDIQASQFRASFYDLSATRTYPALVHAVSTTVLTISAQQFPGLTDSYNATPSSTLPFTWATGDIIEVAGTYEAA